MGTEIPVYGQQEKSAYNEHFGCTCYHPLLLFNRKGYRRTIDQACTLLLVAAGRDAAVVWWHAGEDRGAAVAGRIRRLAERNKCR